MIAGAVQIKERRERSRNAFEEACERVFISGNDTLRAERAATATVLDNFTCGNRSQIQIGLLEERTGQQWNSMRINRGQLGRAKHAEVSHISIIAGVRLQVMPKAFAQQFDSHLSGA